MNDFHLMKVTVK